MTTSLPLLVFIGPPRMASTNLRELLGGILCVKGWTKQQNFIILFKYDLLNIMLFQFLQNGVQLQMVTPQIQPLGPI